MKTTNKILLLSAVTLSLAAVSQAKADDALLSPRAQGNQIVTVTGTNNYATPTKASNGALLSPHGQASQTTRVAGTNNDPDLVAREQALPGSPKDKAQQPAPVYQIAPMK